MGSYLNPGSERFRTSLRSQIYVDKSMLIAEVNKLVRTEQKYVCVSRPRRFGKSMAADMLLAYYSVGEDTSALFDGLKISKAASYREHLNQYDVIKINMHEFLSATHDVDKMLEVLQKRIIMDLKICYPEIAEAENLIWAMMDIYSQTKRLFIILIDEWDCLFREYAHDTEAQKKYLDFLRMWMKDQSYVALVYMTGILPIKKYGSHSALNMFSEYSMTEPGELAEFFGFTDQEVEKLCQDYHMSFEEARSWYDGYELISSGVDGDTHYSMYSPKSVVESMLRHRFSTYWNQTETYEALKVYIQMNLDGLKDAVIKMLAGESVQVDISGFSNDMTTFHCADDVFALLIHLGYLSYDENNRSVSIPNKEVSEVYVTSIKRMDGWGEVMQSLTASKKLLEALWDMNADAVAEGIDRAHEEISILKYNDENSLSCTITLAFYFAREYYTIIRELPTGKGFADICMIPRQLHADKPAIVIELKKDKNAKAAIDQIKQKNYVKALENYKGNLLLVGINYDEDKKHTCVIEKMTI